MTNGIKRIIPRKRAFVGLVGRPVEPKPNAPAAVECETETRSAIISNLLRDADKRKRGRPRKFQNDAEKMRHHRKTKGEAAKEKAVRDEIDAILAVKIENWDRRGRLHNETSGDDVVGRVENRVERDRLAQGDGREVRPSGTNPHIFEDPRRGGMQEKIETDNTWVNHQNFYTASRWDKRDEEEFTLFLADLVCRRGDPHRCKLCEFTADWYNDVRTHFIEAHQSFIRGEIRDCKPNPVKIKKDQGNIVTTGKQSAR